MEKFFSLEEIIELTKKMVEIPSYEGVENQETPVAEILLDFFAGEGIPAELVHVENGRCNIIAYLQGKGGGKGEGQSQGKAGAGNGGSQAGAEECGGEASVVGKWEAGASGRNGGAENGGSKNDAGKDGTGKNLLLCGHTDTVPPYDMADPFTFKIIEGKMYGRGVNDMKGQNACMAVAMAAIKRSGIELAGDVVFAGVIDEEAKSLGARAFIKDMLEAGGLAAGGADGLAIAVAAADPAAGEAGGSAVGGVDASWGSAPGVDADTLADATAEPGRFTIHGAIVGEGTELNICPSQKGLEWLQFNFHGKTVHGGRQNIGINAIEKASKFIEKVEKELRPKIEARSHPNFNVASSMNYGLIKGGTQPSTVAGDCILQIDRRWIPGENYDDILAEYQEVLDELKADDPEFSADFQVMEISSMEPGYIHEVMNTDTEEEVVRVAEKAVKEVLGRPPLLETIPAWTDGGLFFTYGKIPTIVLGPGSIETAHSADEHLAVDQLIPAVLIYSKIIAKFCK